MSGPEDPPAGNPLAGLVAQVGALGRRLQAIEKRLDGASDDDQGSAELQRQVRELAAAVSALAEQEEIQTRGERAIWWPDLSTGEERSEALRRLGDWVEEVIRLRHPEAYKELQSCWFLHVDILDELEALRAAWFAAYRDKNSSLTAAIEWHDRWLPSCMARCKVAIKARACNKNGHQEPVRTDAFLDSDAFRKFVEAEPSTN